MIEPPEDTSVVSTQANTSVMGIEHLRIISTTQPEQAQATVPPVQSSTSSMTFHVATVNDKELSEIKENQTQNGDNEVNPNVSVDQHSSTPVTPVSHLSCSTSSQKNVSHDDQPLDSNTLQLAIDDYVRGSVDDARGSVDDARDSGDDARDSGDDMETDFNHNIHLAMNCREENGDPSTVLLCIVLFAVC